MWEDVQQIKGFTTVMEKKTFQRSSETKVKTVSVTSVQSRELTQILTRSNGTGQVGGASDIITSCPKQLDFSLIFDFNLLYSRTMFSCEASDAAA